MINRTSLIDEEYNHSHMIDDISDKDPIIETKREEMEYRSLLVIWCFVLFLKLYPRISRLH